MNNYGYYTSGSGDITKYIAGYENQMPFALFLAISSNFNGAIERYFSLMGAGTTEAKELAKEAKKYKEQVKEIVETFEGFYNVELETINGVVHLKGSKKPLQLKPWTPPSNKSMMKKLNDKTPWCEDNRPDGVNFFQYSSRFAEILAMNTPLYDSGHEGVPMACSISYIHFDGRVEFREIYRLNRELLDKMLVKLATIMGERKIIVENGLIGIAGYKPLSYEHDIMAGF